MTKYIPQPLSQTSPLPSNKGLKQTKSRLQPEHKNQVLTLKMAFQRKKRSANSNCSKLVLTKIAAQTHAHTHRHAGNILPLTFAAGVVGRVQYLVFSTGAPPAPWYGEAQTAAAAVVNATRIGA